MRHLTSISRIPLHAEQEPGDLQTLVNVLDLLLAVMSAFTTGTQTVFTAVTAALSTKSSQKTGQS